MNKIEVFDYANEILRGVKGGALLSAADGGRVNCMTISWGSLGIEWGKPVFTAYVRRSRYTKELLEKGGEFTVCIPYGDAPAEILSGCGTKSGRDTDKVKEYGLQLEEGVSVHSPAIRQLPLTLECRIIYAQEQDMSALDGGDVDAWYPEDKDGTRDVHTVFMGEIVNVYILD